MLDNDRDCRRGRGRFEVNVRHIVESRRYGPQLSMRHDDDDDDDDPIVTSGPLRRGSSQITLTLHRPPS